MRVWCEPAIRKNWRHLIILSRALNIINSTAHSNVKQCSMILYKSRHAFICSGFVQLNSYHKERFQKHAYMIRLHVTAWACFSLLPSFRHTGHSPTLHPGFALAEHFSDTFQMITEFVLSSTVSKAWTNAAFINNMTLNPNIWSHAVILNISQGRLQESSNAVWTCLRAVVW